MNTPRVLAGLVVLLAIAGAGFLALNSNPDAPEVLPDLSPTSSATQASDAEISDPAGGDEFATLPRVGLANSSSADTRALRVRVTIPMGAPAEPELTVVAASARMLRRGGPGELLQRLRSEGDPAKDFARARVDASGLAELRIPADMEEARLLVDGRFLFLSEARAISTDVDDVTLEPTVGGLLRVQIVAASDNEPRGSVNLMGGDFSGGGWQNREQSLEAGDSLEFRAIDPELQWMLRPSFDEHHADMRMGVEIEAGLEKRLELAVSAGAGVRGEVVDGDGLPLSGAEVSTGGIAGMQWMGGGGGRRVQTAEDGSFTLLGLAPGKITVTAELEGLLDGTSDELEVADGETLEGVRIVMGSGLSIVGIVRSTEREPVEGAKVVVERLTTQRWGGWGGSRVSQYGRATTDATGRFSINGLAEGSYTVRALLEDAATDTTARAVRDNVEAGGPDITLDLVGPLAFAGRVVDDRGEPVTAFRLEVESVDQGGPKESSEFEDAEGRFRFARVGPGTWSIRAEVDGYVQLEELEHVLPSGDTELLIAMQRTARITGTVLDATGTPLAGAEVALDNGSGGGGWGGWGGARGPRAETGAEGRFVLEDVAPGTAALTASADGLADSLPTSLQIAPGDQLEDVVLTLRVGGRIEGQVLTPEGDPQAGRRITWGSNAMGFGSRGDTNSDAGGRFAFEHVTPGEWAVSAVPSMEDFGAGMQGGGQSAFVEVMGKLVTKTVTVVDGEVSEVFLGGDPREPVRITGTVTRAGEPLAGADVYAVSETSAVFQGMKTARADQDGVYELVIDRPGPHTISATAGNIGVERVVEVPRQEQLRVDLAIPLGRIEGRILEPDRSPAAGVRLSLQREDGLGRIRWAGGQKTTDEDGRYAFEDLEAGLYSVRANVSTWGGGSNDRFGSSIVAGIEVDKDQTTSGVDFELQSPGTVTGVVVDASDTPVAGASLYFRDTGGRLVTPVSSVVSDTSGRFKKTGLAPGDYTVSVRSETQAAGDEASVRVTAGQESEVEVAVDTGVFLLVTLEDPDGKARRARVEVLDADGRDVAGMITMEAMRATFNEGRSTLEQRLGPIPPGRYTVRATATDGRSKGRRLSVRARSSEKKVVLKLRD